LSYPAAVVSFFGGDKARNGFLACLMSGGNIEMISKNHRTNKYDDADNFLTFGKEFPKVILDKSSPIEIVPSKK